MIILDTNVVSEPLKPRPDANVIAWLDAQSVDTLCLTTVSLAELRFGIASLPVGKRRNRLRARFEEEVLPTFADRILDFDEPASACYAKLQAEARGKGKAIGVVDGYIAAIALSRGFTVATRDTAPFEAVGVQVINPFD